MSVFASRYSYVLAASVVLAAASPAHPQANPVLPGVSLLPSPDTSFMLDRLPQMEQKTWDSKTVAPRELIPDEDKLDPIGKTRLGANSGGAKSLPFVVPNSMIIQFTPQTTAAEIEDYLEENDLPVIKTFPSIGAVQVEADISEYFEVELTDTSVNDSVLRGVTTAIKEFTKDNRVQSATPDILLSDKSSHESPLDIKNVLHPDKIVLGTVDPAMAEFVDWGIKDIQADQLWDMPGANDGVIFGVMDVGFARHDDLIFIGLPPDMGPDNHGNHVAGISCGRHNGMGIQGVLPNCFVRAKAGNVFFETSETSPQLAFMVLFSQILTTLDSFVSEQDEITTFNVSLGYNWRSNFGINPDLPEAGQWRVLVESQGVMLVALLENADKKGKVIFSAAGNDSSGLATPISAKYASPFNWAAITAAEKGLASNGIIVGAHGPDGKRASFSNKDAQISCPGVDIVSSLAFDADLAPSLSAYGQMSGTSMASPYCAAAHVLFRLVRPGYTGVEAARCIASPDSKTELGTPHVKLAQAIVACPERS